METDEECSIVLQSSENDPFFDEKKLELYFDEDDASVEFYSPRNELEALNSIVLLTGKLLSSCQHSHTDLRGGVQVRNINIGGGLEIEIPDGKRLLYALQHIHGIGRAKAHHIVCELGVENKYVEDLSKREPYSLRELLSKYLIGNDLKKLVGRDVVRLVGIQCYRGIRHADGLRGFKIIAAQVKDELCYSSALSLSNKFC